MSYEELEQWIENHEKALLIVADTEKMARELINICFWLNVASIVLSIGALIMAMAS